MAELLFELGMRLKGSEFVPELRQVVEDKVEEKYEQVLVAPEPEVKPARATAATETPSTTTTKASTRTKRV